MKQCAHASCEGYAAEQSPYCHVHRHVVGRSRVSVVHPVWVVAAVIGFVMLAAMTRVLAGLG